MCHGATMLEAAPVDHEKNLRDLFVQSPERLGKQA